MGKVRCGRQLMAPRGRRDDVDEMVSNKCIHKKINHYLLTLLHLHIDTQCTTKICVLLVCQIANNRGCCGIVMGVAAVMVNHVMGDGRRAGERAEEREMCV